MLSTMTKAFVQQGQLTYANDTDFLVRSSTNFFKWVTKCEQHKTFRTEVLRSMPSRRRLNPHCEERPPTCNQLLK